MYRTGDQALAEDLSSQTFLKAYEAFERYDDTQGAFSTWIYTIANRVLYDHYRKSDREIPTDFSEECWQEVCADADSVEFQFDQVLALEYVHAALDHLPEIGARCVTYRYIDGLSISDIAELLNLSESSVRQHISRNIKRLRQHLLEYNLATT